MKRILKKIGKKVFKAAVGKKHVKKLLAVRAHKKAMKELEERLRYSTSLLRVLKMCKVTAMVAKDKGQTIKNVSKVAIRKMAKKNGLTTGTVKKLVGYAFYKVHKPKKVV